MKPSLLNRREAVGKIALLSAGAIAVFALSGCQKSNLTALQDATDFDPDATFADSRTKPQAEPAEEPEPEEPPPTPPPTLDAIQDFRDGFIHGEKGPQFQKYIVLHDTEGDGDPQSVINWWDGNGNYIAAHFVIGKDGSIYQCVELDKIAHHAGYGNTGHNAQFGVEDESRDDRRGSAQPSEWAADYGMNSYSIGIEMVHVGGSGYYPEEQLNALDTLIAYLDAIYGFESTIIDHKAWAIGNSDTSPEFADYLLSYQTRRVHSG
jgi:hypothetical protein